MFRRRPAPLAYEEPLILSDRTLPLKVASHARARRLTLRIEAGGKAVRVTAPFGIGKNDIDYFVMRHKGWIEARLAKLPAPQEGGMLRHGVKVPFLGTAHLIIHEGGRGTVEIGESGSDMPHLIVHGDAQFLPRRLKDFFKKQAEAYITPLSLQYAEKIGQKPHSIRYKDTTSRWGSCSATGNLSFSWRIMMAPKAVVQYLVAHEVAHLREMNHGLHFWALCEELCPDTKRCRAWLKRNGQTLHAINFE